MNTSYDYTGFKTLSVLKKQGIAQVTLDNGEINLLDLNLVNELITLADTLSNDPAVKVIIFQSANKEYFLSHADFPLLQQLRDNGAYDSNEMPLYSSLLEKFRTMPKATIAKIKGRARGGGAEFILAMDMSFAAIDKAYLSQMEIIMGILPGGGAAQYLARKIGRCRAMEICLSGRDFNAVEAERYGYINHALPAQELDTYVDELAQNIASCSAKSIALNKAAVNLVEDARSNDFIENNKLFATLVKQPDFDRRVEKFASQGGNTRQGELENWKNWARKLI